MPGATADAACKLYAAVYSNTWTIRFDIQFDPATGNALAVNLPVTAIGVDARAQPLAARVAGTVLEVRAPIILNLFGRDAR